LSPSGAVGSSLIVSRMPHLSRTRTRTELFQVSFIAKGRDVGPRPVESFRGRGPRPRQCFRQRFQGLARACVTRRDYGRGRSCARHWTGDNRLQGRRCSSPASVYHAFGRDNRRGPVEVVPRRATSATPRMTLTFTVPVLGHFHWACLTKVTGLGGVTPDPEASRAHKERSS